jgi:hypothetical protein
LVNFEEFFISGIGSTVSTIIQVRVMHNKEFSDKKGPFYPAINVFVHSALRLALLHFAHNDNGLFALYFVSALENYCDFFEQLNDIDNSGDLLTSAVKWYMFSFQGFGLRLRF